MPVRIVQSKQNPRLKELRRALAHPGRNERSLVAIEGPNLVEEALRAGLRVDCIFADESNGHLFQQKSPDIEVLLVAPEFLKSILSTESPQPVAALIEPPHWTWAHILRRQKSSALIVVLVALQDPGNLGTIIRSAEAFGANCIVCLPGTVNPWNPKAVRASAGSIFRLPILTVTEDEALTQFRQSGVRILTTTAQADAQPADLVDLTGPVALLIGNEGNGVPADVAIKADMAITIPCPGPVESLNAAVATSVLLYEAARQRSSKSSGPPERRGGKR